MICRLHGSEHISGGLPQCKGLTEQLWNCFQANPFTCVHFMSRRLVLNMYRTHAKTEAVTSNWCRKVVKEREEFWNFSCSHTPTAVRLGESAVATSGFFFCHCDDGGFFWWRLRVEACDDIESCCSWSAKRCSCTTQCCAYDRHAFQTVVRAINVCWFVLKYDVS